MWKSIIEGDSTGSEGGIILKDEEYKDSCRIMLEKCQRYHAITCGVYGSMVHTAFCSANEAELKYDQMKTELQKFIDSDTTEDEELKFYESFTSRF